MSIFFDDSGFSPVMLEEDLGLDDWTERIEVSVRTTLEHISNYTPPNQCDGTFWGELINIDILHKTKNRTVPMD